MFTWVCPQCGRDVPPSFTECPDCAKKAQTAAGQPEAPPPAAQPPTDAPPPPPQPAYAPPPAAPPPAQAPYQQFQQPAYVPPPAPRGGLPTWLMAILFAFAFVGVVAGIYWLIGALKGHGAAAAPTATVESPAAKPGAKTNPLQKYIEVSGVRFADEKGKPVVKFVITNHSGADISGLAGNVTIWGRTQKSEEDAQGTFTFNTNIGPYESKDLAAPLNTKLKMYELPDWQNVTTDIQVTAPVDNASSGG